MNKEAALNYHRYPKPGKLEVTATKSLTHQADLSLAYSPGVAEPCKAIFKNSESVTDFTGRGNLIAVISNGTAVLGLGNIGPLAAKPVMEGKAVLFKKFADINVFDLEINETNPDKLVEIIASLEPTFGGINLEDIKAPECFEIERRLTERLKIPVFHDDQHGTAIIVCAAVINGLYLLQKDIKTVKLVVSGAGAAAIACVDLLVALGLDPKNVILTDSKGVVYKGRKSQMDSNKSRYATDSAVRTLNDALVGADILLGLSVGNIISKESVANMDENPLILTLANPDPEIRPELVRQVRPKAIIATGRSDYPNQVNNVLCFPFIFRGALDVGATQINQEMKLACINALAKLAREEGSDLVANAYGGQHVEFGPEYIIPKPFDPRLIVELSSAVAEAAMLSGIATRPLPDLEAYKQSLSEFVYKSGMVMRPIFSAAKANPMRLLFAEGEEIKVLHAAQVLIDEKIAHPILLGNPEVIAKRHKALRLRFDLQTDCTVMELGANNEFNSHLYHSITERKGIYPDVAKRLVQTNNTVQACLAILQDQTDAVICGTIGTYHHHLQHVRSIIQMDAICQHGAALNIIISDEGAIFICDTHINLDPSEEEIVNMTLLAAKQVQRFGMIPKVALLSHSNFGSSSAESAIKMRRALEILRHQAPELEIEGEMHADAALSESIRQKIFPNSRLQGTANLLIMPNLDSSNIAFNFAKYITGGRSIGPILLGVKKAVHIVTQSISTRGLVNMGATAVVDAQIRRSNPEMYEL